MSKKKFKIAIPIEGFAMIEAEGYSLDNILDELMVNKDVYEQYPYGCIHLGFDNLIVTESDVPKYRQLKS